MDESAKAIQAAAKGLRKVRNRFDHLLRESGGKRPTTYKKMRQFVDVLVQIVEEETRGAGMEPSTPPIIKTEIDVPSLDAYAPGIDNKGEVHRRSTKKRLSKTDRARIVRKEGTKPVFVPKGEESKEDSDTTHVSDVKTSSPSLSRRAAPRKSSTSEKAKKRKKEGVQPVLKVGVDAKVQEEADLLAEEEAKSEAKDIEEKAKADVQRGLDGRGVASLE